MLYIGAPSEVEMKEKKDRVDDALSATRAAIAEGIVPGGGVAYIRCLSTLDELKGANNDETTGIAIIRRAIEEPLRQIVANAGLEGAVIVQKVKEGTGDFGYNARTDSYENFFATGVIDPAKVTRVALENAASIAGMFLTTECVIADKKEDNPVPPMSAGGMPGMMSGADLTNTHIKGRGQLMLSLPYPFFIVYALPFWHDICYMREKKGKIINEERLFKAIQAHS